jgi:hypothetical protein
MFLGQKRSLRPAAGTPKDISIGHQGLAVSTLFYKSIAVESLENGVILPSERRRSEGLSALQEISALFVEQSAGLPLEV